MPAPKAAYRPSLSSTDICPPIVHPQRSRSTQEDCEVQELEEEASCQEDELDLQADNTIFPPNFFQLIKQTMRNEIVEFCTEGFLFQMDHPTPLSSPSLDNTVPKGSGPSRPSEGLLQTKRY